MAYQTRANERVSLSQVVRLIYNEIPAPAGANSKPTTPPPPIAGAPPAAVATTTAESLTGRAFRFFPLAPFYRGFSVTVLGIIPYAGISFLTYGNLKALFPEATYQRHRTSVDLACGGLAGLMAQSASYPFEVVRRRMQVGGVFRPGGLLTWRETVKAIWKQGGWRGFYVGLGIGWLKVIPMNRSVTLQTLGSLSPFTLTTRHVPRSLSISFATWQFMKRSASSPGVALLSLSPTDDPVARLTSAAMDI